MLCWSEYNAKRNERSMRIVTPVVTDVFFLLSIG